MANVPPWCESYGKCDVNNYPNCRDTCLHYLANYLVKIENEAKTESMKRKENVYMGHMPRKSNHKRPKAFGKRGKTNLL